MMAFERAFAGAPADGLSAAKNGMEQRRTPGDERAPFQKVAARKMVVHN
jgi:hypothetical protein